MTTTQTYKNEIARIIASWDNPPKQAACRVTDRLNRNLGIIPKPISGHISYAIWQALYARWPSRYGRS